MPNQTDTKSTTEVGIAKNDNETSHTSVQAHASVTPVCTTENELECAQEKYDCDRVKNDNSEGQESLAQWSDDSCISYKDGINQTLKPVDTSSINVTITTECNSQINGGLGCRYEKGDEHFSDNDIKQILAEFMNKIQRAQDRRYVKNKHGSEQETISYENVTSNLMKNLAKEMKKLKKKKQI